jgi:four helix bundle protein
LALTRLRTSSEPAVSWRVRDFRKLIVWQKAHRLALDVHLALEDAPSKRYSGLRSQILRSAASIPANLAEGCGKQTNGELARFAEIALGSITELDNHLLFAREARVLGPDKYADFEPRVAEVRRMLFAFVRAVRSRTTPR